MAINFDRLFERLGKFVGGLNEVNTYRGTTLQDRVSDLAALFTTVNPDVVSGIYSANDSAVSSFSAWLTYLSTTAKTIIQEEVYNDRPITNDFNSAYAELVRQMVAGTESLNSVPSTVTVTAGGSNVSDGHVIFTNKDGTGQAQDLMIPDSYLIQVVNDQNRSGTAYAESGSLGGKLADSNPMDYTYASGSGQAATVRFVDPALTTSALNTDPGFSTWTTNVPTYWTVATGTSGTNVFQVSADPRSGGSGLAARLVSTGSLVKLRQTISTIRPNTVYAVSFKVKVITTTTTNFRISMRLVNASSGATFADDAATTHVVTSTASNSINDGNWHSFSGFLITPKVPPSAGVALEIVMASASDITAGSTATCEGYVDHAHLSAANQLYTGGPYYQMYSNLLAAVTGDNWTVAVVVPSSGDMEDYLIRGIDRLVNLRSLSVRMPTSGSPTQADALVV